MKRCILIILILINAVSSAYSQEEQILKRKLFIEQPEKDSGIPVSFSRSVYHLLEMYLADNSGLLIMKDRSKADVFLEGSLRKQGPDISAVFTAFDYTRDEAHFTAEITIPGGKLVGTGSDVFKPLSLQLDRHFPQKTVMVQRESIVEDWNTPVIGVKIRLSGAPGTVIYNEARDAFPLGDDGQVIIEARQNTTLTLRAEHAAYYPEELIVVVGEGNLEINIEQKPAAQFDVQLAAFLPFMYISPRFSWYYKAYYGFVTAEIESNLLTPGGIFDGGGYNEDYNREYKEYTPVFIIPSISSGWSFMAPDAFTRFHVSGGIFTRLVIENSRGIYASPLYSAGLQLRGEAEFRITDEFRMYMAYKPLLFYSSLAKNSFNEYVVGFDSMSFFGMDYVIRLFDHVHLQPFNQFFFGARYMF